MLFAVDVKYTWIKDKKRGNVKRGIYEEEVDTKSKG